MGDLITASFVAGVAHPPGYPLFTLLGFLLTRIDFSTPAFMVGLISAVSSSLAVLVFYFFSLEVAKNRLIALLSSFIFAFNFYFWFYAEIAEVFALNNFFVVSLIFFSYLFYKYKKIKFLYILSFLVGLSLTNHHTIILLFPSIAILVLSNYKKIFLRPKAVFISIFLLILGLSVYLYVPLASSQNPPVNWDNVKDLNSFLHLVLRKDYGTLSAGFYPTPNSAQRVIILNTYFFKLISQLTIPVIVISLLGAFFSFRKDKKLFYAVLIGFFLSGPFFIAYAGFPLLGNFFFGVYERFLLMSSVILLFFLPQGLLYFSSLLSRIIKKRNFQNLFVGVFFIIPLSLFYYNFPKTDLHQVYAGDYLAYDLINPLPKDSLILLSGDTSLFNAWYLSYALNFREDVKIVNLNRLEDDRYLRKKIEDYKKNHPNLEKNKDPVLEVIKQVSLEMSVYSSNGLGSSKENMVWAPYGLTFRLLPEEKIPSKEEFLSDNEKIWEDFKYLKSPKTNSLAYGNFSIADIPSIYAASLINLGNFTLTRYDDESKALDFYKRANEIDPNYHKAYEILGIYYSEKKECKKANDYLAEAISLYPLSKISYFFLYSNYKDCFKNDTKAKETILRYQSRFGSDFFKDLEKEIEKYEKSEN